SAAGLSLTAAWRAVALLNTMYSFYWDVFMDWGLGGLSMRWVYATDKARTAGMDQTIKKNIITIPSSLTVRRTLQISLTRTQLIPASASWLYLAAVFFDFCCRVLALLAGFVS